MATAASAEALGHGNAARDARRRRGRSWARRRDNGRDWAADLSVGVKGSMRSRLGASTSTFHILVRIHIGASAHHRRRR